MVNVQEQVLCYIETDQGQGTITLIPASKQFIAHNPCELKLIIELISQLLQELTRQLSFFHEGCNSCVDCVDTFSGGS